MGKLFKYLKSMFCCEHVWGPEIEEHFPLKFSKPFSIYYRECTLCERKEKTRDDLENHCNQCGSLLGDYSGGHPVRCWECISGKRNSLFITQTTEGFWVCPMDKCRRGFHSMKDKKEHLRTFHKLRYDDRSKLIPV